jgi:integrase/recombinase XerD
MALWPFPPGESCRFAEDGGTTHELMAFSGHRTLSEVQRYTDDADRERLADQAMAKRRRGPSENADATPRPRCTNTPLTP